VAGSEGLQPLRGLYPTKEEYLLDIPRLIIEHNLHGIDIDRRAVQIAGLSLWLRAQRAWHQAGVNPADRPRIRRSNIVCAEPMPGEKELLREFVEQQFPAHERPAFAFLLEKVFDRMTLAGEAGSLLRIEEEIRDAIAEARAVAKEQAAPRQLQLLPGDASLEHTRLDLSGLTDEEFWQAAEGRIYHALRAYAEQTENGSGFRRRLFADDAAQGFAFIDLCRKRYDVVVMNPPFGEVSLAAREYLYRSLPESSRDIFASFVRLFAKRLIKNGRLGVLTNRMASFNEFLGPWREEVFMGQVASLEVVADLGYGVLDAVVEAAAYVCSQSPPARGVFVNCLQSFEKQAALREELRRFCLGERTVACFEREVDSFRKLPGNRFSYTFHTGWLPLLNTENGYPFYSGKGGICTGDDFRFYRCFWEIDWGQKNRTQWRWLAKGGEFSRYRTNAHLAIDWRNEPSPFENEKFRSLWRARSCLYTPLI